MSKNLYLLCFLFVISCSMEQESKESVLENGNFQHEVLLKKKTHPYLLDFSFEVIYDEDQSKIEENKLQKEIIKDSIIITFFQDDVWIGCGRKGDLKIRKKYIKLIHEPDCDPSETVFVTESALVKFRYCILNKDTLAGMDIKVEGE